MSEPIYIECACGRELKLSPFPEHVSRSEVHALLRKFTEYQRALGYSLEMQDGALEALTDQYNSMFGTKLKPKEMHKFGNEICL